MTSGVELAGKVALVTGGARNIGRAIARSLAAGGAAVMVNARTSRAEAEETLAMIEAAGGKAALHIADVTDPEAVAAMVDATVTALRAHRHPGQQRRGAQRNAVRRDHACDEWRQVLSIYLDGAFLCAQAALPQLASAGGGTIVNIGGLTAHKGATGRAHVIAAKSGLAGDDPGARPRPRAAGHHRELRGAGDRSTRCAACPARRSARAHRARAAAGPPRRARGGRRDGAHAVSARTRATSPARRSTSTAEPSCHDSGVPPMSATGQLRGVNRAAEISPVMRRLSAYIAARRTKPLPAAVARKDASITCSTPSRRWCRARACCPARRRSPTSRRWAAPRRPA